MHNRKLPFDKGVARSVGLGVSPARSKQARSRASTRRPGLKRVILMRCESPLIPPFMVLPIQDLVMRIGPVVHPEVRGRRLSCKFV